MPYMPGFRRLWGPSYALLLKPHSTPKSIINMHNALQEKPTAEAL